MPPTLERTRPPGFDRAAFPIGLGFVAGFVDLFGFMAWYGLLAANVTGNLIFLAYDITRGEYALVLKFSALPIFAVSVAASAWFIGMLTAHGRRPFQPAIIVEAAALGTCLVAGLLLPPPQGPDDAAVLVAGASALFAMGMQNTVMRLILNNLPPTTVVTGNITHIVAEAVRRLAGFGAAMTPSAAAALASRAKQVGLALAAFAIGAIAGGQAELHVGYPGLLLPIAVLLGLLPLGRAVPVSEMKRGGTSA
jgi:uncharacterized membrane protein YoaK (UPF0700 family)